MGWTLGYLPPKEPVMLDVYLLAVGKALCIATNFEAKCKYVVSLMKLVDVIKAGESFDAATELVRKLDAKRMLGETIRQMGDNPELSQSDVETLRAAKDSRNYIAHESAGMPPLSDVRASFIERQLALLHTHVAIVAKGESLVSAWCYEISEKEHAPQGLQDAYVQMVLDWVGERKWERNIEIMEPP